MHCGPEFRARKAPPRGCPGGAFLWQRGRDRPAFGRLPGVGDQASRRGTRHVERSATAAPCSLPARPSHTFLSLGLDARSGPGAGDAPGPIRRRRLLASRLIPGLRLTGALFPRMPVLYAYGWTAAPTARVREHCFAGCGSRAASDADGAAVENGPIRGDRRGLGTNRTFTAARQGRSTGPSVACRSREPCRCPKRWGCSLLYAPLRGVS